MKNITTLRRTVLLFIAVVCLCGFAAAVEFDSGSGSGSGSSDSLVVSFSGVDDVADAWVFNSVTMDSGSLQPAVRAEWSGRDASASRDISNHLRSGSNYIILTLFNKVYSGFSLNSSGGKYKADISVKHEGDTVYSKSLQRDFNDKELVFAAILKAVKSRDGSITVTQSLSDEEEIAMRTIVTEILEPHLMRTTGEAKVDYGSAIKKLASNPDALNAIMGTLGGQK